MQLKRFPIIFALFYFVVLGTFIVLALIGDRAITVMMQGIESNNRVTIIIDAGHGGEDGGATSCSGTLESTMNLEIALRLNDLMHLLGYQTKMVRTTDTAIHTQGNTIAARKASDLRARVQLVNSTANAMLISIHQNYFTDEQYKGAQVFYAKTSGSDQIARLLQNNLVSVLNKGSRRKEKMASGIYLMDHINCPGILVECGFLSNYEEEAMLRNSSYQKKICCVIASAVSSYIAGKSYG